MISVIKDEGEILTLSNGLKVLREDLTFYLDTEEDTSDKDTNID